jgi:hypothetical protein
MHMIIHTCTLILHTYIICNNYMLTGALISSNKHDHNCQLSEQLHIQNKIICPRQHSSYLFKVCLYRAPRIVFAATSRSNGSVLHRVTHVAQNTCYEQISIQGWVSDVHQSSKIGNYKSCDLVYINETNIDFDLLSGMMLAWHGE